MIGPLEKSSSWMRKRRVCDTWRRHRSPMQSPRIVYLWVVQPRLKLSSGSPSTLVHAGFRRLFQDDAQRRFLRLLDETSWSQTRWTQNRCVDVARFYESRWRANFSGKWEGVKWPCQWEAERERGREGETGQTNAPCSFEWPREGCSRRNYLRLDEITRGSWLTRGARDRSETLFIYSIGIPFPFVSR